MLIIGADDVARRRGYCDHFVAMSVGVWVCGWRCMWGVCWHSKMKTPDRNDLKPDTVLILDSKGQRHRINISKF